MSEKEDWGGGASPQNFLFGRQLKQKLQLLLDFVEIPRIIYTDCHICFFENGCTVLPKVYLLQKPETHSEELWKLELCY